MDPLTAGLQLANTIATGIVDVFKAAPASVQEATAANVLTLLNNMGAGLIGIQAQISAAVTAPKP
jgi:hypothetical protein